MRRTLSPQLLLCNNITIQYKHEERSCDGTITKHLPKNRQITRETNRGKRSCHRTCITCDLAPQVVTRLGLDFFFFQYWTIS